MYKVGMELNAKRPKTGEVLGFKIIEASPPDDKGGQILLLEARQGRLPYRVRVAAKAPRE